jgi:hypothetical protein
MPRKAIRATQAELMEWARISHNTLKAHVRHLSRVGLLKVNYVRGDNTGAEYEIFTPEETPPTTHQPPTTYPPETSQNLAPPTSQNLVLGGGGQVGEESITSTDSKTSFKTSTENDDDEAGAAELTRIAKQLIREITGKEATQPELRKIAEVLEVVMLEGKIAAARTTVSSAGPFLAEHLRRRLFKKDKQQLTAESTESETVAPAVDTNACPDCAGVGWYYPEGKEKGMAKCRHARLGDIQLPGLT